MKISSESLKTGPDEKAAEKANAPVKITYDKSRASIQSSEDVSWNPVIFEYAKRNEITVGQHLKQALEARLGGVLMLSPREIDIAARGNLDFKSQFLLTAFLRQPMGTMLTEGTPGESITGWNLRTSYNKGLKWLNEQAANDTPERRKAGTDKLDDIRLQLANLSLPLWPNEIKEGVKIELTKPEWMTWQQYTDACQKRLFAN